MATTKEETTLLPSSLTKAKIREGRFPVSRAFCILHVLAFALLVCWLTFLTFQCGQPEARVMLREEIIRQLVTSQEVREGFQPDFNIYLRQARGRRQMDSVVMAIEGDILVRDSSIPGGDQTVLDAHLADPSRLWPSGVVEYKFYDTLLAFSSIHSYQNHCS